MAECTKPPRGWCCTRLAYHEGACEVTSDVLGKIVEYANDVLSGPTTSGNRLASWYRHAVIDLRNIATTPAVAIGAGAVPVEDKRVADAVRRLERKAVPEMGQSTICDRADLRIVLDALSAAPTPPDAGIGSDGAGDYVAGPIWAEPEDECFTAEVQTVGGHYVVATVHGSTRDEAEQRQSAVLRAFATHPGDGGRS